MAHSRTQLHFSLLYLGLGIFQKITCCFQLTFIVNHKSLPPDSQLSGISVLCSVVGFEESLVEKTGYDALPLWIRIYARLSLRKHLFFLQKIYRPGHQNDNLPFIVLIVYFGTYNSGILGRIKRPNVYWLPGQITASAFPVKTNHAALRRAFKPMAPIMRAGIHLPSIFAWVV